MAQEGTQLLLKDLCARLPYGVKVSFRGKTEVLHEAHIYQSVQTIVGESGILYDVDTPNIKPYLRPMSSMTSKEWVEFCDCSLKDEASWAITGNGQRLIPHQNREDYLNSKHFDYRGLIEMGLALEAPDGMYNKEESEKESEIPIPKTIDEAISTLEKILSDEDREYLLKNGAISMHDSLGRWIRNEWGLWTGSELKNELKKKGFEHPDDMSNYVIEEFIKYWNNKK